MILGRDIHPEKKIYYIGALVLETLNDCPKGQLQSSELYMELRWEHGLSVNLFALALDWLFLLGAIKHRSGGMVEKCF